MKTIMLVAGGTGGHVFPALSLATLLQDKGYRVAWIGTRKGMEKETVGAQNIPFYALDVYGLRGKGVMKTVGAIAAIVKASWQAFLLLKKTKPEIVVCFGGFVSAPVGLAAALLGIPLVLQEQNAVMGWANAFLSLFAHRIAIAFPELKERNCSFISKKMHVTGNPVRQNLWGERFQNRSFVLSPCRLLVLGGSQGADPVNTMMVSVWERLLDAFPDQEWHLWHQSGVKHEQKIKAAYKEKGLLTSRLRLNGFIEDMAEAYAWADLVVARSGALTVAEIAAVGLPAIFIPYPYAVDNHQAKNAACLQDAGAAFVVLEGQDSEQVVFEKISVLLRQPLRRQEMALNASQQAQPQATEKLFLCCQECL
jgi:UDP-N-acetylglucosamine--N-acetylmuramyl-(pentapeptide) pyrophosphoryl-undecaprenol N-acetylglucosamine transferase